jgi:hypothetical protein
MGSGGMITAFKQWSSSGFQFMKSSAMHTQYSIMPPFHYSIWRTSISLPYFDDTATFNVDGTCNAGLAYHVSKQKAKVHNRDGILIAIHYLN